MKSLIKIISVFLISIKHKANHTFKRIAMTLRELLIHIIIPLFEHRKILNYHIPQILLLNLNNAVKI